MILDYPARRARLTRAINLTDEIVLVAAGNVQPKPEVSDQMFPFVAHQEYYYLTGTPDAPGGILAFDPRDQAAGRGDGGWTSFVPKVTDAERLWEGRRQLPGTLLDHYATWISARKNRPAITLGAGVSGIKTNGRRSEEARDALMAQRRVKEPAEIELMRRCAAKTAAGYAAALPFIRPGFPERRIQVELEAEYFRRGATGVGYQTIVGSGPNSAVLHAAPTQRPIGESEFILIDSGAELDRYVIDVSRTYVAGKPSRFQEELHQTVLNAQMNAIARCLPGAEWKDIHFGAAMDLVSGLVAMNLMNGDPAELVDRDAHLLFFPHGIGHMVGLGVRDASGLEPGRTKDPRPCLGNLRMDLILRPGHTVTVEPGVYFIPDLLDRPDHRAQFDDCINWPLIDRCRDLGGVRVEDTILVTGSLPENLTRAIPKTL